MKSSPATTLTTYAHDALSRVLYGIHTVLLFSKSDLVPVITPSMGMCLVLGAPTDLASFIQGVFWFQLHILSFEVQNQITGYDEDRLSKPTRPIVSGRISLDDAQKLYYAVLALTLLYSSYHRTVHFTIPYFIAIMVYNEGGLSKNWFMKSFLGAIGYSTYISGTTRVFDHHNPLSATSIMAVLFSATIHTTTGHAQDFRDRSGDAAIGRFTLAHIEPQWIGRGSLTALVCAWTVVLVAYWEPPLPVSIVLAVLGIFSSCRYCYYQSEEADRDSYWWYSIWLLTAHALPAFRRLSDAGIRIPSLL
ncbi:hypothetical protein BDZ89DRAFT_1169100 [Hymenopellis radicata]|nr:hypothetical protein BDZ89DRAFT_1169100 [Hymenopellis radicata]